LDARNLFVAVIEHIKPTERPPPDTKQDLLAQLLALNPAVARKIQRGFDGRYRQGQQYALH